MRCVVFCGIQASGKSTYFRERFADTHVRLNLDMLRTRHREAVLLHACLSIGQPFVVDNTSPTAAGRARYLYLARSAGYEWVDLFHFDTTVADALRRNAGRPGEVRAEAIHGTAAKLQVPTAAEGFDRLVRVSLGDDGAFTEHEVTA